MSAFEVKHTYFPAKSVSGAGTSSLVSPDDLAADYKPNLEEFAVLSAPIEYFLSQCTCYDMMGISTQVVVVDVEATLAVAFIAAQETRVQSCVLWDPRRREFVGVLSSTDYIKILLYCEAHPQEADQVSSWTIRHWREVKDTQVTPSLLGATSATSAGAKKIRPTAIVTCTADASLRDCLAKMKDFNVRRIVALAEKEAASFSVISMMDVAQIVEYLGVMFFHIEKAGSSLWHHPPPKSPDPANLDGGSGGAAAAASGRQRGAGIASGPLGGARTSASAEAGRQDNLTEPGSSHHRSISPNAAAAAAAAATAAKTGSGGASESLFTIGETALPPRVSSILSAAESEEAASSEAQVGPYRSIFDIPFKHFPANVGAHRHAPVSVTMDSALNEALKLMLRNDVESVAVCTSDKIIVDVVSRSDLLRMENQGVYDTSLTVREALASKISDSIFVIYEQDTARDIFAHFVRRRVKELFIVDPDTGKLQGQLNVSEFVHFLVFTSIRGSSSSGGGGDAALGASMSASPTKSPSASTTSAMKPGSASSSLRK